MPDSRPNVEATLKKLVGTVIHDVRNQVNGIVLELTDLRERFHDPKIGEETESLMRQSMEMARKLRDLRERLEPAEPQKFPASVREVWALMTPQSPVPDALPLRAEVEWDAVQIQQAVAELVANAEEASGAAVVPTGRIEGDLWVIAVVNEMPAAPAQIELWGCLPGYTTKRRHLGLGCSYAVCVARAHGGGCRWRYEEARVVAEFALPWGQRTV